MRRLTHVRLPKPKNNVDPNCWCVFLDAQDIIQSVQLMEHGSAMAGDNWQGDWLSPMGIDLQINGGFGLSFSELTFDELPKLFHLLDQLWIDGVEAICPTFISCAVSSLHLGLEVLREARRKHSSTSCQLLGAHLEGPFLSKNRNGAHALEHLCLPSLSALEERIQGFENEIDIVTLAPELSGSLEVIRRLKSLGIVVSLGHSSADAPICHRAFENGVTMLTHAFNAMPGLQHRSPGPIGEALKNSDISIGLIADGVHVHPDLAVLLQKLASKQLVLVSDAISPYGLQDGQFEWDHRLILSEKGSCRLQNGTLVGTTVPLLQASQNLMKWGRDPASAIWAATVSPRLVLGKEQKLVDFLIGKPLRKLLRWHINFERDAFCWQRAD